MQKLILFSSILFFIPFVCSSKYESGTIKIPLTNNNDVLYTEIMVASTAMRVLINTGSNEFWVPGKGCDLSWCQGKKKFDGSKSRSYKPTNRTFVSEFGGGAVEGPVGMDDIGLFAIFIKAMEFGEALKTRQSIMYLHYDGSLGLGPQAESSVGSSFLQRLVDSKLIDSPAYSFSLEEKIGTLYLGSEGAYRGQLVWSRIVREDRWQIKAENITLGDTGLCSPSTCQIEFNTAIEITLAPPEDANKLFTLLGAKDTQGSTIKSVDCKLVPSFPDLVFSVGGSKINLTPADYVTRQKMWKKELCWLSITAYEGIDRWVVGATEHKTLHVVYDFGKKAVGLAHAL